MGDSNTKQVYRTSGDGECPGGESQEGRWRGGAGTAILNGAMRECLTDKIEDGQRPKG